MKKKEIRVHKASMDQLKIQQMHLENIRKQRDEIEDMSMPYGERRNQGKHANIQAKNGKYDDQHSAPLLKKH